MKSWDKTLERSYERSTLVEHIGKGPHCHKRIHHLKEDYLHSLFFNFGKYQEITQEKKMKGIYI